MSLGLEIPFYLGIMGNEGKIRHAKHSGHFNQAMACVIIYTFIRSHGLEGDECTKSTSEDNYKLQVAGDDA